MVPISRNRTKKTFFRLMAELLIPNEVDISLILNQKTFSPKKFAKIDIPNRTKSSLQTFLNSKKPFYKGEEPGSFAYVNKSRISFVRNSCINSSDYSNNHNKEINLNPNYGFTNALLNEDILLCKDANIGDSCLFISQLNKEYIYSSGVAKLNFDDDFIKYYVFAFLRDSYFLSQLDSMTPRGSTIRHSGNLFLNCLIPKVNSKIELFLETFKILIKNIAYSEQHSFEKLETINKLIDKELLVNEIEFKNPDVNSLLTSTRIDAGFYSEIVQKINCNIELYKNKSSTIFDLGFILKRGPNLAQRDLGRSVKSIHYKPNYHLLVYPSDISDRGYITKQIFIGARNPVWYLQPGDILFSAEGTVGKVFIICQNDMKFITNFHGIIITPTKGVKLTDSIMLGVFLNYLRSKEYIQKVTVGGQGGSLPVNYWQNLKVPNFKEDFINIITSHYHSQSKLNPLLFDIKQLEKAGVYELNNFRILCKEILEAIVLDIKNNSLKDLEHYKQFYQL